MKLPALILFLLCITRLQAQPGDHVTAVSSPLFIPAEKTIYCKLGDGTVPVKILQYGDATDVVCLNLHDNEWTSVQAAQSVLGNKGGLLIKIENRGQRVIRFKLRGVFYSFDPNRMFSRTGIEQTLRDNRKTSPLAIDAIEAFANRVLELIPDTTACLVALHNNTNAAFSIKSYQPGNERQRDAREVYAVEGQDMDDIALTTDSVLYRRMADLGYNSIWQDNEKAKKDGSLSIYCGERGRRYINIETEHGRVSQYVAMLEALLNILVAEKNLPPVTPEDTEQAKH